MLKGYRTRFVLFNLILVGVALLLALLVQGVYLYRSNYSELKDTMRMVVTPLDDAGNHPREEHTAPPEKPDGGPKEHTAPPEPKGPRDEKNRNVITAFYNPDSDDVSLISVDVSDSEAVLAAVREAAAQDATFGTLPNVAWIYYKESGPSECKIALTDSAYLYEKQLRTILMLLAVYLGAMTLVFFISVQLSKRAAKPMERAIEMERQFIADISHDLKTPITVILANNSILKAEPREREQWLDSTEAAAKKMMTLVDQMLTLSALESADRAVEKKPVPLSSTAERVALELDSLAFERGVTIETEIAENVFVPATEEYAERICASLLENALKYEPSGGRVRLTLTAERKKATLTVQNPGSVIAPEDLPHVFERFYRGDKARSEQSGHGLGLPIVKQMVDLLGAQIRAESRLETGTVFTVVFDCTEN